MHVVFLACWGIGLHVLDCLSMANAKIFGGLLALAVDLYINIPLDYCFHLTESIAIDIKVSIYIKVLHSYVIDKPWIDAGLCLYIIFYCQNDILL